MIDLSTARWRKARRSQGANACVEVAGNLPGLTAVRDSKDPAGPALTVAPAAWREFVAGCQAGEFDR